MKQRSFNDIDKWWCDPLAWYGCEDYSREVERIAFMHLYARAVAVADGRRYMGKLSVEEQRVHLLDMWCPLRRQGQRARYIADVLEIPLPQVCRMLDTIDDVIISHGMMVAIRMQKSLKAEVASDVA